MTGERKAIVAAIMAMYAFLYLLVFLGGVPGWGPFFGALASVYAIGFVAIVAGYFWGRWYATGVGFSGLAIGAFSIFQIGAEPILLFYAVSHGLVAALLWGNSMEKLYDGQTAWRERFHLDDNATHRLGKAITRVGLSLPYVLMWALAPKDGAGMMTWITGVSAIGLTVAGLWGVHQMRTWSIFAFAGAAVFAAASFLLVPAVASYGDYVAYLPACSAIATGLLVSACTPFAKPIAAYLRS